MNTFRLTLLTSALCACALAACSPEKPWLMERSMLNNNPIQLVESRHIVKKPVSALEESDVVDAARVYRKNGAGPMYVVIAYKDHGKLSDANVAQKTSELTARLRNQGVAGKDIVASTVPLETDTPVALIAFDTLEARGPKDCMEMPGMNRMADENFGMDYQQGCEVKSMMARQIANPRDLEGRAGLGGHADGDHAANVVTEQYKPGAPHEYLPSYVISELAGSGG